MTDQDIFHPADEVYERFWLKALENDIQRLKHTMVVLRQLGYVVNIDTTADRQHFITDIQKPTSPHS